MTDLKRRGYWDDHDPTPRQRAKARKVSKDKKHNRRPDQFGRINWDVYEHREMWDMVKSADPGKMGLRTHDWKELAKDVDQATTDVRDLVQKLVGSWHGPSSVAASASVSRLMDWATDVSDRASRVGTGMDAYTDVVQEAARRMPVPVHPDAERWFRAGYDVTTLAGPQGAYMLDQLLDDHLPSQQEKQRAKAEAVQVMQAYEDASRSVHDGLPKFEEAPEGTKVEPDHRPQSVGPDRPPQFTPAPPVYQEPRPQLPTRPEGVTTTAAAVGPAGFGIPGLPGGASVPGGYAAGSPGGHSGFGPGGFGPGGYASGGGFGPLGPGGSSGVIGAVPGGAAARGGVVPTGAGGQGGFGMFPPAAPAGREEDREHRNRYDNGLDLLDDLPPAFPPVLGE